MQDVRCRCDKLVAKVENNKVIIKCRHCKRFVVIHAQQIESVEYNELKPKVQTLV